MSNRELLFCDVETTGLSKQDEVLELALIDSSERIVFRRRFGTVHKRSWNQAQHIHGISPDDVKNLKPLNCYEDELRNATRGHDIVFYNAAYDTMYLKRCIDPSCRIYCAMLTHDRMFQRRKLMLALADHGIDASDLNAHSAADDCIATARLWKYMSSRSGFMPVDFFCRETGRNHRAQRKTENTGVKKSVAAFAVIILLLFLIFQ